MTFAVTGSFEDIAELMFGPAQHNAHVKARNVHRLYARHTGNFDARMADMKAYAAELNADWRARNVPSSLKIAAE